MKFILLLFSLVLVSCSSKKPLYEKGTFGDRQLDEGIYLVTFEGTSSASVQEVQDMLYLRCAELALKNGYPYFIVLDGSWRKEEIRQNYIWKLGENYTLTNKIKLVLLPVANHQNYDAKAIFSKRIREIEGYEN